MTKITIVNVVATASLNQELDFDKIREAKEVFHDSDVYYGNAAYFKTEGMQGKVSFFLSGKMISVGTKSEKKAVEELNIAMNFLAEKGFVKRFC
jgi:TATA-box binding protein (TBP) (component of TFIID and TFIIIB)